MNTPLTENVASAASTSLVLSSSQIAKCDEIGGLLAHNLKLNHGDMGKALAAMMDIANATIPVLERAMRYRAKHLEESANGAEDCNPSCPKLELMREQARSLRAASKCLRQNDKLKPF